MCSLNECFTKTADGILPLMLRTHLSINHVQPRIVSLYLRLSSLKVVSIYLRFIERSFLNELVS